ncbi:MAG: DNA cytosine methyltransferase [Candidatus Bathyarchaeota archaeon]|nr:DNA cytosine methyltransferase [Candidatus Termiticorpusculum sp.]
MHNDHSAFNMSKPSLQDIRVCELFAGIGGFRLGLEQASPRFRTVYANDLNPYCSKVYRYHYYQDNTFQEKDIRNVDTATIPKFDLLVGGFPCQPFSSIGNRQGLSDQQGRGTLFKEILRFAKDLQPKMLLLENVPGLHSINAGDTFKTILCGLGELGYTCEWQVFNSKYFGVPQNRRRIFITGYLTANRCGGGTVFPIRFTNSIYHSQKLSKKVSSTLTTVYNKHGNGGNTYIITNNNKPLQLRAFTPVECERLQGFPDNWTRYGLEGSTGKKAVELSVGRRYILCGNAVTVNVIKYLGGLVLRFFDENFGGTM